MNSSGKSSTCGLGVQGGERGGGSAAGSMWREEGEGADLSAVSAALTALLLGYLDAALPHPPTDQQHSSTAAAGTAEEDMQVCSFCPLAVQRHSRLVVHHCTTQRAMAAVCLGFCTQI